MSAPENVSVIVATFGSKEWEERGAATAAAAHRYLKSDGLREVAHVHLNDGTLAQARNLAASQARGTWLCFLDGDDSLNPDYARGVLNGWGCLRQPKTTYSSPDGTQRSQPAFIPPIAGGLWFGNWLVIGTAVRRSMFEEVGGFDEYEAWEDFACWLKCARAGAIIGKAPRAVYHIGPIKPGDRNQQTIGNKVLFDKIVRECG